MMNTGKGAHSIYADPENHAQFMHLAGKTEILSRFESQVYRKDGKRIWISESVCAVKNPHNGAGCYAGTVHDVTMRKRQELHQNESLKELQFLADKAEKDRYLFLDIIDDMSDSYQKLEGLFISFVSTITGTIDEKMPWMKGHSERVASYALKIARAMGIQEDEAERIKLAALLHDIGKILMNHDFMNKSSTFTKDEFELVKRHPVYGESILEKVGQLGDIIPMIRHHHERIDGNGYPDGLRGEEIPVGAKILHVADSYDSMTADRPYRRAPGKEYAFHEFKRCMNTQFDLQITRTALKVL
jgi:putative nucleotidyltransferase with HDIG domain